MFKGYPFEFNHKLTSYIPLGLGKKEPYVTQLTLSLKCSMYGRAFDVSLFIPHCKR